MPETFAMSVTPPSLNVGGTQNSVSASPGGLAMNLSGCIFTSTAQQVTSGTGASPWIGSGVGTTTIPANFLVPGKTIRIKAKGLFTTQATPGTTQMAVSVGGATFTAAAATVDASLVGSNFDLEAVVTCQTAGASATMAGSMQLQYGTTAGAQKTPFALSTTATGNTTVSNAVTLTGTNSVSGGTVFTINNLTIEVLN